LDNFAVALQMSVDPVLILVHKELGFNNVYPVCRISCHEVRQMYLDLTHEACWHTWKPKKLAKSGLILYHRSPENCKNHQLERSYWLF